MSVWQDAHRVMKGRLRTNQEGNQGKFMFECNYMQAALLDRAFDG
mgnify:CR=1 FL=1